MKRTPEEQLTAFVKKAELINRPIYAGIDSGSTGAVGFICGPRYLVLDIPTVKAVRRVSGRKRNTSKFDRLKIITLFEILDRSGCVVRVLIETALPRVGGFGRGAPFVAFKVGCAYAMWPLFLESKDYKVREVMPHVWKGRINLPGGNEGKEVARARAIKHFPLAELHRKKDHNRAEALLLAKYGRDRIFNEG